MKPNNPYPGYYIVLEGIIGAGKSTQIGLLLESISKKFPEVDIVPTFEPGGTEEANKLRLMLKNWVMDPIDEVKLFAKARASSLSKIVRPALERGSLVISDRSFVTGLAYQAFGREIGLENVWDINKDVVGDILPDCLVYLKIGLEASQVRSGKDNPDKFDREERKFWGRVIPGYEEAIGKVLELSPKTEIICIENPDGLLKPEVIQESLMESLTPLLSEWQASREGRIVRERQGK